MTENLATTEQRSDLIESASALLAAENDAELASLLGSLEPVAIAHLIESFPDSIRVKLWALSPSNASGEVLVDLGGVARQSLVEELGVETVVEATANLDTPDLAAIIGDLSDDISDAVRESLDYRGLRQLDATLAFPEDSAGRLMTTDAVAIRADISLETVLRYLRRRESLPTHTSGLMVVNRDGLFLGELPLSALLTRHPDEWVSDVMNTDARSITPEIPQRELASLFQDYGLVSMAVVDEQGRLVGRITIDDVLQIIHGEAAHQIMGKVGLDEEEDLFSPVMKSAGRRAFWLGINLATAFLAAYVIGLFEATLQKIVALAVLMPIVASMGGIAGSQTLTLIIRGLALDMISSANTRWLAYKEISIAVLNGVIWAVVVGAISFAWFEDIRISLILSAAMILNLFAASVSGVLIPLGMKRFGIDPALAGSIVLTTVTDVVGFMSFLGLATIFLI